MSDAKQIKFIHKEAGESMWLEIIEGDEIRGRGRVLNDSVITDLSWGDEIMYEGGTETTWPFFVMRLGPPVDSAPERTRGIIDESDDEQQKGGRDD